MAPVLVCTLKIFFWLGVILIMCTMYKYVLLADIDLL
jgi:hypothetical protein